MDPFSDAELVQQCLQGQKEAFAELVERHQGCVFNVAYRMTNNREDAADLAQEAFVRAYRKLAQYRPDYAFRNWVVTICANMTKNRFRSRVRRWQAEEAYADAGAQAGPAGGTLGAMVVEALEGLNEKLRLPLVLKHVEGFSYEEVAAMLGLGVSAAKMRVKRGKDELLRLVESAQAGGGM